MITNYRNTIGKLYISAEANREYYALFEQTEPESGEYVCQTRTQTSLGQHFLDLLESSKESIRFCIPVSFPLQLHFQRLSGFYLYSELTAANLCPL